MANEKILVCDDEMQYAQVIAFKFRNAGYEVTTALDGQEALKSAKAQKPDLIITDYQMPRLDGMDLCREIRKDPGLANIPLILLTAFGMDLGQEKIEEAGVSALISKPFSPRDLLSKAKELLEQTVLCKG